MNPTRRDVLKAGTAMAAVSGSAGCLNLVGLGAEEVEADGYTMFFALNDWAEQVAGDQMRFENPVSTGKMGHGWNPSADITPDVAATGMFIYLDTPDFEWARRVANNLERDHDDVVTIDLLDGIEQYLISPTDDHEGDGDNHDESEDGQNEFYDPHVWIDPIIVQEMVDKLTTEFAAVDPDNADSYEENAAAYNERVQSVHESFERTISEADLDVAILAGHDSYSYVEQRYGFELKTPTGISPDASPSIDDIRGLVETIDENEIETILYDPFEGGVGDLPQLAESILEDSSADNAEPLTPVSGTLAAWDDNDWGWVEQMTEVNITSLETALNPSG